MSTSLAAYLSVNLGRVRCYEQGGQVAFYIHPLGVDGETLDFTVVDNALAPLEGPAAGMTERLLPAGSTVHINGIPVVIKDGATIQVHEANVTLLAVEPGTDVTGA